MYSFNKDIETVLKKYTLLEYNRYTRILTGEIELFSESGGYIDIFEVEIKIPDCFPRCFPKVTEIGGKIPRTVTRHVMPDSNYLCLAVWVEELLICKNGITLQWFIDKVLVPRLCEEYRVNNGERYQQEYSHDLGGTWEFLMKKLELNNPETVLNFLETLANKKRPNGNSLCLCRSGKSYSQCHKKQMKSIQHMTIEQLTKLYELLKHNPYKGPNL